MAKLSAKGNGAELARFEVTGSDMDGNPYRHQYAIFANGKVLKKAYAFPTRYSRGHWTTWKQNHQLTEQARHMGAEAFILKCSQAGWVKL